jgi:indolepyruvate ferredoxin oxidoreductase beta subunit
MEKGTQKSYDIYLVGVGGQGVLTIAEIITEAAFHQGIPVNYYPTEGMAQRGGFVKAQVRLGRPFTGPNLPEKGADLVIAMEISESLKAVRFSKPGSDFFLWSHIWAPTTVMLGKAGYPTLDVVKEQVFTAKANLYLLSPDGLPYYKDELAPDNLFVLGAAIQNTSLQTIFDLAMLKKAIRTRWPKSADRNLFALQAGAEAEIESVPADAQQILHP